MRKRGVPFRYGRMCSGPHVFQLLFRAVDTLGGAVQGVAAGSDAEADAGLIAELDAAAANVGPLGVAVPHAPSVEAVREEPKSRRASDAPRSRPVQVTIRPGALMRGARAALVLRRAEGLLRHSRIPASHG